MAVPRIKPIRNYLYGHHIGNLSDTPFVKEGLRMLASTQVGAVLYSVY